MFDRNHYLKLADDHRDAYASAQPFAHAVLDDFLPESVAARVHDHFPDPKEMDDATWQYDERKIASSPVADGFPDEIRQVLYALNGHEIVAFLERLTGIDGLLPDPHFVGSGLHQTLSGGRLGVHVDFNVHKHLQLYRRVNLLVFLNRDWEEEYGGHLELWNTDMSECVQRVAPVYNRAVVFSTTDTSYHGHPDPLQTPRGVNRKSIALYYYSNTLPNSETQEVFWTRHLSRPDHHDYHFGSAKTWGRWLRALTPPALLALWRRAKLARHGRGR